ncbi:hypothetical protein HID58_039720, partial [Brassica napus]
FSFSANVLTLKCYPVLICVMASNENLPPNVIKQLAKELKSLDESPPDGIKVVVNDEDFSQICADIEGPVGTPYENGLFRMKLALSHDFPHSPPKGYFMTKIFHPNVASNGEICVNTLKKDWNPSLGLRHVLSVVRCLLIEPFPESALNEQAGKMLLENYEEYARHARLYTGIHAKPKPKFKTGAISESTTALNVGQPNNESPAAIPSSVADINRVITATEQIANVPVAAAAGSASVATTTQKREAGLAKVQADKKKPNNESPAAIPSSVADINRVITATEQIANVPVAAAAGSASVATTTQKREAGLAKVQADKKKVDARKKSLKRL